MSQAKKLLKEMRGNPDDVRFADAVKVATKFFGKPRVAGSHHVFTVPGRMPINLQSKGGKAKGYQIEQPIEAIDSIKED